MLEHALTDEPAVPLGSTSPIANPRPESRLLSREFESAWEMIGRAIALAGSAYPIVLALGMSLAIVAERLGLPGASAWGIASAFEDNGGIPGLLFASMFAAVFGLIWAGMVCAPILPLVYLFVRSLQLRGNLVWLGAFTGGLVGFVAVTPLVIGSARFDDMGECIFLFAAGPGLATIIGQIGGAWGAWRKGVDQQRMARAWSNANGTAEIAADGRNEPEASSYPRIQFRIRHILWISIWLSLLLAAIRCFELDYRIVLPLLVG